LHEKRAFLGLCEGPLYDDARHLLVAACLENTG